MARLVIGDLIVCGEDNCHGFNKLLSYPGLIRGYDHTQRREQAQTTHISLANVWMYVQRRYKRSQWKLKFGEN